MPLALHRTGRGERACQPDQSHTPCLRDSFNGRAFAGFPPGLMISQSSLHVCGSARSSPKGKVRPRHAQGIAHSGTGKMSFCRLSGTRFDLCSRFIRSGLFPLQNESCVLFSPFSEGPCLIHSMNGDLLRTLAGPENCLKPKLIQASREGHCVIFYENGFFCTFSVNGKLQATMETEDNIRVSASQTLQDLRYLPLGGMWGGERVP